jgi:hypothetical protein
MKVLSKGLRQQRKVNKKKAVEMGSKKQQQARRAQCRAGGRMGVRARLTRKKLGGTTTHKSDSQVARFFKSRDEQDCSLSFC